MKEIKYLNKIKEFLYLFFFGILLPFFFDNFYFNMLEAKADIAYLFLKILFIPLLVLSIYEFLSTKDNTLLLRDYLS